MADTSDGTAQVPATPEFVQVLRNVAAGVAARLEMPIDQIEEIRLAVTEAASLLLEEAAANELRMRIRRSDDGLDVTISSDGTPETWPSDRVLTSFPPSLSATGRIGWPLRAMNRQGRWSPSRWPSSSCAP